MSFRFDDRLVGRLDALRTGWIPAAYNGGKPGDITRTRMVELCLEAGLAQLEKERDRAP